MFRAISHDLQTPITRLRLRVDLIKDDAMRGRLEDDLLELELLVKGALQSLKDTDIHENVEPVDIKRLVARMAEAYRDGNQSLVTVRGHSLPYRGKPLALSRCLGNLLDNAVKYGERAAIILEDSADRLRIQVDDRGPGIPEAALPRIFDPYYRHDHQHQEGHGLGLGIARNIAHNHGGEMTVNNRPGGGLRVTLDLPRR
jgi:signal transduction histidine kinase